MAEEFDFLAIPEATTGASSYEPLEEGAYEACLAAIVGKKLKGYQTEELEDKIIFVFQIRDDENKTHYVSTIPMKRVINDKSNLFQLLNSWTKKSMDELVGLNMGNLIGKPCQLTIAHETKGEKTYLRIAAILPPKKNTKAVILEDEAPYFITKGAFFVKLADGITIVPEGSKKDAAPAPAPATAAAPAAPAEDEDEDRLPF